jgi:Branched-chain amino acid ABC-type transport system, permease components
MNIFGKIGVDMSLFIQSLVNGLNQGAIYALIALGYTMVYGIIRMINFAHGDFIMVGSYTLFYTIPLMIRAGMPAWMAVFIAIVVCTVVGVTVEIVAYRPVRKAGSMTALITALAMSLFLENLAMVLFGANPKSVPAIFNRASLDFLGAKLQVKYLLTLGIGIIMMVGLQLFVKKTKLGKAMRAVPQDKQAATLMGIKVNTIITITFAIGSALAAVAALMYCSTYPRCTTDMGCQMGLKAFIAAVLGGIGSIPGAMVGGLLVGLIEILVKVYIAPGWYEAITYSLLIIVLIVKPSGILGKNIGEKV